MTVTLRPSARSRGEALHDAGAASVQEAGRSRSRFGYGGSRRVGRPHRASLPDRPRYFTGRTRGAIGYSASPTASKPSRHERKVWIRMILPSRTTL